MWNLIWDWTIYPFFAIVITLATIFLIGGLLSIFFTRIPDKYKHNAEIPRFDDKKTALISFRKTIDHNLATLTMLVVIVIFVLSYIIAFIYKNITLQDVNDWHVLIKFMPFLIPFYLILACLISETQIMARKMDIRQRKIELLQLAEIIPQDEKDVHTKLWIDMVHLTAKGNFKQANKKDLQEVLDLIQSMKNLSK